MISNFEVVLRLVLAAVLGGAIGYQREVAEKPAGLRTHLLVSLGSSMVMLISVYPFLEKPGVDVSRIAAQVITGIGFLGAGAIIRQGSIVKGLTTAASLWAVAGIGLAVGIGFYAPSILATVLILLSLTVLKKFEGYLAPEHEKLLITSLDKPGQLGRIGLALGEIGVDIRSIDLDIDERRGLANITLAVVIPTGINRAKVMEKLTTVDGLTKIGWE
jgi:putative Mg2+ transporter-C (MgtC) family protein